MTRTTAALVAVLLALAAPLAAQATDANASAGRTLPAPPYRDQPAAAQTWAPTLAAEPERPDVLRQAGARHASAPKTGALIGGVLGGLAGAAVGFLATADCESSDCSDSGGSVGYGLLAGAGVGAALGFVLGFLVQGPARY